MEVDILINPLSDNVEVGIYKDFILYESIKSDLKASEFLIEFFDDILNKFTINRLIYANGPGNFMGIKITYIILRTISIIKKCEFYSVSGFDLNNNGLIRANKNFCFTNVGGKISLTKGEPSEFLMPKDIRNLLLNKDTNPNYILDPI